MKDEREAPRCAYLHAHEDVVARVRAIMPDENVLMDLSDLYRVFGDSTRIRILYCLLDDEMCVCDVASLLGMSQSAISHQLAVLKKSKLIRYRRAGKTVFYALADEHVRAILHKGVEHVTE